MPPITDTNIPVVVIKATDPRATWSGDTGTVTVFRFGNPDVSLNVFYRIGGTATNGVDYESIGNSVSIPAGAFSNSIVIKPLNHGQTSTQAVTLALVYSPMMPPVNYAIGTPSIATVMIRPEAATNYPPIVHIAAPASGTLFRPGADIPICAQAWDRDGYVDTVEFFVGSRSLGIRTNNPVSAGSLNPFCLVWSNAPAGDYLLTAKATDNDGATQVSEPVRILVGGDTNLPPMVRISSPANNAVFRRPLDLPVYAFASDKDDPISRVDFFAGTTLLGQGSPLGGSNRLGSCVWPSNMFVFVWSNAPAGTNILTARAMDSRGAVGESSPVRIFILPPSLPPTNPPLLNVVGVVASNPIAIEGTNCWVWRGMTNPVPSWSNWTTGGWCLFTNCGPKNATFTVRRAGATNEDLVVSYAIGGTASNGVDYVELPGKVTIASGERAAFIDVVPIDDGILERNRSVILKLNRSANYLVGRPASAAALIVDSLRPSLRSGLLGDNLFHLSASGPDGAWFHIEYSTNLVQWFPVCTNQVVNGSIDFLDPDATADSSRFYRAVPESASP